MVTNFLCLLLLLLLVSSVSFLFTFITVVVMCDCYLEWHADGGSSPGLLLPSGGNQLHRSHQCTLSLSGEALDLPHQSMLLGVILRLACMLGLGFRTANPARLAQSRSHIVSMVNRMLAVSNVSAVFCSQKEPEQQWCGMHYVWGFWVQSVCPCVQKSPELDGNMVAFDCICAPAQWYVIYMLTMSTLINGSQSCMSTVKMTYHWAGAQVQSTFTTTML